ncbi:MAG: hypothetical protein AAB596_03040 [Patescibacteria group bacterium]
MISKFFQTLKKNAGMFAIITLPVSAGTDLMAYAGTLFTDLYLWIVLAVGIPLGFYIINRVIGVVRRHAK